MTSPADLRQDVLLAHYVASFEKLEELRAFPNTNPIAKTFAVSELDEWGQIAWRPRRLETKADFLDSLYAKLPAKFPPLFERLLLTFRWAEVDLKTYTLLANPLGPDLQGFFAEISRDPGLWKALVPAGYLRFAKGSDMDYDPVCFDMNSRRKGGEMRVVKIDHEEILCNCRIKVVSELAPSFEALTQNTIDLANRA